MEYGDNIPLAAHVSGELPSPQEWAAAQTRIANLEADMQAAVRILTATTVAAAASSALAVRLGREIVSVVGAASLSVADLGGLIDHTDAKLRALIASLDRGPKE